MYYDAGDYGCTEVTATCPFHNRSLDSRHLGQPLVDIQFANNAVEALYGPPLGQTASVNTFTGSTRQQWHGES